MASNAIPLWKLKAQEVARQQFEAEQESGVSPPDKTENVEPVWKLKAREVAEQQFQQEQQQKQEPSVFDQISGALADAALGPLAILRTPERRQNTVNAISDVGAVAGGAFGSSVGPAGTVAGTFAGATLGAEAENLIRNLLSMPPEEQLIKISQDPVLRDIINTAGIDLVGGAVIKGGAKVASKGAEAVSKRAVQNFPELSKTVQKTKGDIAKAFGLEDTKALDPALSEERGNYIRGQLKQTAQQAETKAAGRKAEIDLLTAREKELQNQIKSVPRASSKFPIENQFSDLENLNAEQAAVKARREALESEPLEYTAAQLASTNELLKPFIKDKSLAKDVASDIVKNRETVDLAIRATNGRVKPLLQKELFSQITSSKEPLKAISENRSSLELLLPGKTSADRKAAYENVESLFETIAKNPDKGIGISLNGKTANITVGRALAHPLLLLAGYSAGLGFVGSAGLSVGSDMLLTWASKKPAIAKALIKMADGSKDISKAEFKNFINGIAGTKVTIQAGKEKKTGVIDTQNTLRETR